MCSWVSYIVIELYRQHAHTIHLNLKGGKHFQKPNAWALVLLLHTHKHMMLG